MSLGGGEGRGGHQCTVTVSKCLWGGGGGGHQCTVTVSKCLWGGRGEGGISAL